MRFWVRASGRLELEIIDDHNGVKIPARENNGFTNQTVTYTYDSWGNLTAKSVYAYTTATDPGTPISTISYGYSTGDWKDQLVSYDGQTIVYDAMGNPTTYRGKALTWRGKQLTGIADGTDMIAYSYDENGLRLQKTVNNVVTDYYYNGSVLIGLTKGTDTLRFSYDAAGNAAAVDHNGTYYYYLRNGQGDIVKIVDATGATVVEYTYDSWGKLLSCTGTLATTLGALNPFRYRGYVYDEETQWYYLRSRYYDPEVCRFISADVFLSTGQWVIGHNCYACCLNNPVGMVDDGGSAARDLAQVSVKGGGGDKPVNYYRTMDEAAIAFAWKANRITGEKNVELCAFIYASSFRDHSTNEDVTYYCLSDIYVGKHANVIESYICYSFGAVGFVHSHPNCNGHCSNEKAAFSSGDCLTAAFTGVCYMSDTASGFLFRVNRPDAFSGITDGIYVFTECEVDKYGIINNYTLDKRVTLVATGMLKAGKKYICTEN